jgi:hypothetical protein
LAWTWYIFALFFSKIGLISEFEAGDIFQGHFCEELVSVEFTLDLPRTLKNGSSKGILLFIYLFFTKTKFLAGTVTCRFFLEKGPIMYDISINKF